MNAHGALDSLLSRLTTILVEEAQLLGRVCGDVEFIKEEMDCMNSLNLQLIEVQYREHLVRAWMKQVIGLTRDCEGNIEHYIHYVGNRLGDDDGLLGYLHNILRFVRTIPAHHRIATRIRELKVHARDIGDRRQRYGVTMPASTRVDMIAVDIEPSGREEDLRRRTVLLDGADEPPLDDEEVVIRVIHTLMKYLSMDPDAEFGAPPPQVIVLIILGADLVDKVAEGVYQQHSSVATKFNCKACSIGAWSVEKGLADVLKQVGGAQLQPGQKEDKVTNLISQIQRHLEGLRLVVVTIFDLTEFKWKCLLDALLQAADGCCPGSAIIMSTNDYDLALLSSPYKIMNARSLPEFYLAKAQELNAFNIGNVIHYREYIYKFSAFARMMFLHLMYVNPC